MFKITAILPTESLLDVEGFTKAINDALDTAALWVQSDFNQTVATWQNNKPEFPISTPFEFARDIQTENEVYGWVNNGTPQHEITPRTSKTLRFQRPFAPKTQKNVIGSYAGNRGDTVVHAKRVTQGILGREFDSTIQREWDEEERLAKIIQASLENAQ